MMVIRYLDENMLYETFLNEITEIMGLKTYDPDNKNHVEWLNKRLKTFYLSGAKSMCLFSDYDMPLGFLTFTHEIGLDGLFICNKANINLFAVKKNHRGKGYGTLMIEEISNLLREENFKYLYVDTYKESVRAVTFYIKNGFTPIACFPDDQIHFYKEL